MLARNATQANMPSRDTLRRTIALVIEAFEPRCLLSAVSTLPVIPPPGPGPYGSTVYVASGSDGNLWFTEQDNDKIGRMTPAGQVTEFVLPTPAAEPQQIIAGPDGTLWFVEAGANQIGRITTSGAVAELKLPSSEDSAQTLAAGPDGNVWFIDSGSNQIGRVTPQGQVTEFPASSDGSVSLSSGITAGSDGNLWFTAYDSNGNGLLDRMTPSGTVTSFPLPSSPLDLVTGPDGNLWVDGAGEIDRVTPAGAVTQFALPNSDSPFAIADGPDGNLWFGVDGQSNNLGRITPSGAVSEFDLPGTSTSDYLNNIVWGPRNQLWYASSVTGQINSFDPATSLLAGGQSLAVTAGSASTQTVATFTDPLGGGNASFYQASIDWGDGATSAGTIASTGPGQFTVSAAHAWGIGFFTATVTITDVRPTAGPLPGAGRGAVAVSMVQATAPTPVGAGLPVDATAGKTFTGVVATFSNVVLSSLTGYSASIDWGDGHITTGTIAPDGNGGLEVSGATRYAASGTFTITTQLYTDPYPPIYFDPGPWQPRPLLPIAAGGTATGATGSTTTPTIYSAGAAASGGTSASSPTAHLPARYMPVKHTTATTSTGASTAPLKAGVVRASAVSAGRATASPGSGAIVSGPIDVFPIWGQLLGSASATSTATVAAGVMNGAGYTVLSTPNMPFNDVIASFTLTDPAADLSHYHATVDWDDPGIPQFRFDAGVSTQQPASITPMGSGSFTVSASNTFTYPGVSHFEVLISDDRLGSGDSAIVGAAYGVAFVPWSGPIPVDPAPIAWAGGVVNPQNGAAATPTGNSSNAGSIPTPSTPVNTSSTTAYPALAEHPTAKTVNLHVKAGHRFSGKVATISGLVLPKGQRLSGLLATIDWGDGSSPTTATLARGAKGTLVVSGRHTFQTAGAATIRVNLMQPLATLSEPTAPPPIHLPTVMDSVQVLARR